MTDTLQIIPVTLALPFGTILWHDGVSEIPLGWALCDGSLGTPDLTDRFVMGAGTVSPHTTGGSATVSYPDHVHQLGTLLLQPDTTQGNAGHGHIWHFDIQEFNGPLFEPQDIGSDEQVADWLPHIHYADVVDTTVAPLEETNTHNHDLAGELAVGITANEVSTIPPAIGINFIMRVS